MQKVINYQVFYEVLMNLREEFYRNGRLDDSNAKLDEIVKLLVTSYYESMVGTNRFELNSLERIAQEMYGAKEAISKALRFVFEDVSSKPMFFNNDGTNIFGPNPSLNIQPSENEFAINLVKEISKIDFSSLLHSGIHSDFDIINECFGHFVRDNFRNNKEDGQYMTPQEIIYPVLDMVFHDIFQDADFNNSLIKTEGKFLMMDPTCGVGTFLIEGLRYLLKHVESLDIPESNKKKIIGNLKTNGAIGQDKVDRMVRLSKINMLFMGANISNIYHGNSITNGSNLDDFIEKVDLIITNPPFGAVYNIQEVKNTTIYSILNNLDSEFSNIDSELILLDRCIKLLKPLGRLVIVLPDSVVSAKGIYSNFRDEILKTCDIKAIIDLPGVTFAQAGTRTKCVILYLQKKKSNNNSIFMSVCDDIGYDVKERKGVPVKLEKGINQMPIISKAYTHSKKELIQSQIYRIELDDPSCSLINEQHLLDNFLTPNFYKSDRLKTMILLERIDRTLFDVKELGEIAEFVNKKRKALHVNDDIRHISVLHINPDYTIDFEAVNEFQPVTKGNECFEGDVILSKINPRIPRVAVVPEFNKKLVCSNEFEILVAKNGVDPYLLLMLLNMELVRNQIECLTAGTSSSHNRIKRDQLSGILIPMPKKGTTIYNDLLALGDRSRRVIQQKYSATRELLEQKLHLKELLGV
ncbi:N-6 DNA methylase [Brevibacillus fluminis]|uniref:N-6 DNA methylase n=1 Tax=Brevibacillus fluminis TaxID=511487 RepID=UPI003F8B028D